MIIHGIGPLHVGSIVCDVGPRLRLISWVAGGRLCVTSLRWQCRWEGTWKGVLMG